MPSHLKKYTVDNRKIVLQELVRTIPKERVLYDLPKQSKIVNLAQLGEEPKPFRVAQDLTSSEETLLFQIISKFRDVFAWT